MKMTLFVTLALFLLLYPFYVVHKQAQGEKGRITRTPAEWGADYETIRHLTSDGLLLAGWWVPGKSDRAVLLLHGKAGNRNGRHTGVFDLGAWYWRRGYNVMLVDMRAHGESEGRYVTFGVREHADMLGWVRKIDPKNRYRRVIHGFSMGAVTALMMKEKEPGRFRTVVADAPWIDFDALVKQELWKRAFIPPFAYPYIRWVAETFFGISFKMADNTARVGRLCGQEILYIFEEKDTLLPPLHRKRVVKACPGADVVVFDGVGHVEAFRERREAYLRVLESKGL